MSLVLFGNIEISADLNSLTDNTSEVSLSFKNNFKEPIKNIKTSVFLFDKDGEMITTLSSWAISEDSQSKAIRPDDTLEIKQIAKTSTKPDSMKVAVIRILTESGELKNPITSVSEAPNNN